jgi:hypothetical protein
MDVSRLGATFLPAPGPGQALLQPANAAGWTPQERGFKVFISYSRGDSAAFAGALVHALEKQGLAARLDTRDLEFGEKWQGQLKDFIRQADAVVYVVSPRAIASKWCRWELAQVAAQSKRLVPVVHLDVKPEELPAEIGEVQLFNARPGVDYPVNDETAFTSLAGRLALLPLFPSLDELVRTAQQAVPRCLSRSRARSLGLGLDVPRWCITGPKALSEADPAKWSGKWPYDTQAWRDWQKAADRGEKPELPAE